MVSGRASQGAPGKLHPPSQNHTYRHPPYLNQVGIQIMSSPAVGSLSILAFIIGLPYLTVAFSFGKYSESLPKYPQTQSDITHPRVGGLVENVSCISHSCLV